MKLSVITQVITAFWDRSFLKLCVFLRHLSASILVTGGKHRLKKKAILISLCDSNRLLHYDHQCEVMIHQSLDWAFQHCINPQHLICKISGRDLKHFKRLSCPLVASLPRRTTLRLNPATAVINFLILAQAWIFNKRNPLHCKQIPSEEPPNLAELCMKGLRLVCAVYTASPVCAGVCERMCHGDMKEVIISASCTASEPVFFFLAGDWECYPHDPTVWHVSHWLLFVSNVYHPQPQHFLIQREAVADCAKLCLCIYNWSCWGRFICVYIHRCVRLPGHCKVLIAVERFHGLCFLLASLADEDVFLSFLGDCTDGSHHCLRQPPSCKESTLRNSSPNVPDHLLWEIPIQANLKGF